MFVEQWGTIPALEGLPMDWGSGDNLRTVSGALHLQVYIPLSPTTPVFVMCLRNVMLARRRTYTTDGSCVLLSLHRPISLPCPEPVFACSYRTFVSLTFAP